jgi:hypothetical protein
MSNAPTNSGAYMKIVITKDVYAKIADMKEKLKGQHIDDVVVSVQVSDTQAHDVQLSMSDFLDMLGLADANDLIKPCDTCGGSGEVSVMEPVYQGEPHMADTGTASCPECSAGHEEVED